MSTQQPVSGVPVVAINPPQLPEHFDVKGVVEAARGIVQESGKGFIPVADFSPTKPYEEWTKHLEDWQRRLDESPLDPATALEELKAGKKELEIKHENDFERRLSDLASGYNDRKCEWKEHHRDMLELFTQWRDEWKDRFNPIEVRKDALEEELVKALVNYYDTRLQELARFHEEFKGELNSQITNLRNREKELNTKIADMEQERRQWMDERRDWLLNREERFDAEKQKERDVFNTLRERVIKNEHPHKDDIEKTASQIFAERFDWRGIVTITVSIIMGVTVLIGICLVRGNTNDRIILTTTSPITISAPPTLAASSPNTRPNAETTTTTTTTTNGEPQK